MSRTVTLLGAVAFFVALIAIGIGWATLWFDLSDGAPWGLAVSLSPLILGPLGCTIFLDLRDLRKRRRA